MAGAEEIRADAIVVGERVQRVGALVGGDAGRQADAIVDRDREGGALRVAIGRDHRLEVQPVGAVLPDRRADDAARVADHEGDLLGRRLRGGHDEVALVLAVVVVDHHDELAGGNRGNRFRDFVQAHGHPFPAMTSQPRAGHAMRHPAPARCRGRSACGSVPLWGINGAICDGLARTRRHAICALSAWFLAAGEQARRCAEATEPGDRHLHQERRRRSGRVAVLPPADRRVALRDLRQPFDRRDARGFWTRCRSGTRSSCTGSR